MIKIDDWVIEKGEKAQGKIKITGYGIAMPATVICGVKDGPTILITAGIHSAEYVGIQAAMELAKEFQPEELKGNVIIIPLVNVSGFEQPPQVAPTIMLLLLEFQVFSSKEADTATGPGKK